MAVSGGPDSLALLLLAHGLRPGGIAAVTVDHALRAESAAEAASVAAVCARLDVPHTTLTVRVGSGNLHDSARDARYRAMGEWAAARGLLGILTAHHADDQAETLLMRLNRGSGLGGLAGIRAFQPFDSAFAMCRPLLGWRKAELERIVAQAGLDPVIDPSNADPRFDRARIRAAIGAAGWLDPAAIARSADHLQEAEAALWFYAAESYDRTVQHDGAAVVWTPDDSPRAVRLLCMMRALAEAGATDCALSEVARLHDRVLATGTGGTLGGVECRVRKGTWRFAPEPPRRTG